MSELTPFAFDGTNVRVITDEAGEPWFVAADVARILGYREARDLTRGLDEDEKGPQIVRTPGGEQSMTTVTEAGLYSAIMRSRVEAAKPFRRWVTHEVLPAIRKTGGYSTAPALTGPQLMAAALIEAQATMAQQTEQIAIATPKAEAFDAFLSTTGDYSVNEAAKILSRHHDILTGERRLRTWMEANGWIYRQQGQPRAYQRRLEAKTLAEKAQFHYHPETGERVADTPQVRVTARGIEALAKALTKVADQGELDVEGAAS
jgi:prophage antirepressor-like protein